MEKTAMRPLLIVGAIAGSILLGLVALVWLVGRGRSRGRKRPLSRVTNDGSHGAMPYLWTGSEAGGTTGEGGQGDGLGADTGGGDGGSSGGGDSGGGGSGGGGD